MHRLKCTGWWEQYGYGRQPMENLELQFLDGRIRGQGLDMVGEFTFDGTLTGNEVYLLKQYLGKHQIEYHGTSDGEGTYVGVWSGYGFVGGRWLIRVGSVVGSDQSSTSDIVEL